MPSGSGVLAIASNTFRECSRNRVLHALLVVTAVLVATSYVLGVVTTDQLERRMKVMVDLSLSAILLLGAVSAIFLGTNLVYQEVDRRTVMTVLSRPVERWEFVLGKYVGLVFVMLAAFGIMTAAFFAFFWLYGGFSCEIPLAPLCAALLLVLEELLLVTAIALFFSVAAHPIEGAVFSFFLYLAGHAAPSIVDLVDKVVLKEADGGRPAASSVVLARVLRALYYVVPNFDNFDVRMEAAHGLPIALGRLIWPSAYCGCYVALLLLLSMAIFGRKTL